jgi:hypothetical protein
MRGHPAAGRARDGAKEGEKRTLVEVQVDAIGPSLRYATARITRAAKNTTERTTRHRRPASVPAATTNRPF